LECDEDHRLNSRSPKSVAAQLPMVSRKVIMKTKKRQLSLGMAFAKRLSHFIRGILKTKRESASK